MSSARIVLMLLAVMLRLMAQAHPSRRNFLVNRDVVALAQAGYDEQTIIETVLAKPSRFDVTTHALGELAAEGISERVIQAMLVAKNHSPVAAVTAMSPHHRLPPAVDSQGPLRFAASDLPMAARSVPYSAPIQTVVDGRCRNGNPSLFLTSGSLPKGVALNTLGLVGTPEENGTFQFTIRAANDCASISRTFELLVTGKPILEAGPDQVSFSCSNTAQTPAPKRILVSSTWPSIAYTAEVRNAAWLHVDQEMGITPDPGSALTGDVVTLTVDPTGLKPGTYRGSILFHTRYGANSPGTAVVLVVGDGR